MKPLYDRVIVKRIEVENKTAGGIIIPDSATKEKPQEGEVVAVGEGRLMQDGTVRALSVNVGDKVLFGKWGSVSDVTVNGEDVVIMKEDDILAIL